MSASPTMRFREVRASDALAHTVACYWEFVVGPETPVGHMHTIPPDGCVSLSCIAGHGPPGMVGPRLESLRIPVFPGTTYIGVRLNPGASRSVLGWPGERLKDYVGLLASVNAELGVAFASIAKEARSLDDAAPDLTRLLSEHLAAAPPPDELVLAAAAALTVSKGQAKTADIAARSGIGERQFQRRFKREVGLTPKQFARVCRVRAAAVDVVVNQAGDWGQVAVERGFADQSHLVREFAHIFGMTPSEFSRTFAPGIEHVDVS